MKPRPNGAVQKAIQEILLKEWDPIGVQDIPEAQDEYDSYVPGVEGLVLKGASVEEIAMHLARIEGETMGLPCAAVNRMPVAAKLRQLGNQRDSQ